MSDDGKTDNTDDTATANVGGFKFDWDDEGNVTVTAPPDFGYTVTVAGGKVTVTGG